MVEALHVGVTLGKSRILEDISFSAKPGEWMMLCGPNGAGKSTLLRAIAQACSYTGEIRLCGHLAGNLSSTERARLCGVLLQQHHPAYGYTVRDVVALGRYAHRSGFLDGRDPQGGEAVEKALAWMELGGFADKNVQELSGGELQRVFLAQVLAQNPRVLLLDEPANHLDPAWIQRLFDFLADWLGEGDRTLLTVVHDLSLARVYGSRACLLSHGHLAACGDIRSALCKENLEQVYGMDVAQYMRRLYEAWKV